MTREVRDGGGRSYTFEYTASAHRDAYDHWKIKTVETRPDGSEHIVYTNCIGQILIKELRARSQRWIEARTYDADGRQIERARPSAVADYDVNCAQKRQECMQGASRRHEQCFENAAIVCTVACAIRCRPRVIVRGVGCVGICVVPYWLACDYDLNAGQGCCDDAFNLCIANNNEWPGFWWQLWHNCPIGW